MASQWRIVCSLALLQFLLTNALEVDYEFTYAKGIFRDLISVLEMQMAEIPGKIDEAKAASERVGTAISDMVYNDQELENFEKTSEDLIDDALRQGQENINIITDCASQYRNTIRTKVSDIETICADILTKFGNDNVIDYSQIVPRFSGLLEKIKEAASKCKDSICLLRSFEFRKIDIIIYDPSLETITKLTKIPKATENAIEQCQRYSGRMKEDLNGISDDFKKCVEQKIYRH